MTPTHTIIDSPLGELTLVSADGVLTGVYYPGHWTSRPRGVRRPRRPGFEDAEEQLGEYLAGERTASSCGRRAAGDAFQERVWELIAPHPVRRDDDLRRARRELGDPALARPSARAVGRNPLSIVVPCHRVVGKDGKLTGYAGGLERKRLLLDLEAPSRGARGVSGSTLLITGADGEEPVSGPLATMPCVPPDRARLLRRGIRLEWATLTWNVVGIVVLGGLPRSARAVRRARGLRTRQPDRDRREHRRHLGAVGLGSLRRERRALQLIGIAFLPARYLPRRPDRHRAPRGAPPRRT